jgi:hypothetical protein
MPINTAVEKPGEIYQIKVTLLGTDPPIWRRLLVPADLTLERLHDVLQLAVGWEDCHMHEFRIGKQRFGKPDPLERAFGRPRTASERTARLFTVLDKARAKAVYTYDFGDGCDHEIVVEKCLTPEPGRAYPACLAGERHGPPEDCGGLPGFHDMLEAISDPRHEQHDEILEWLGGDFDPEAFSVDDVNQRLAPLQRRRKKAAAGKSRGIFLQKTGPLHSWAGLPKTHSISRRAIPNCGCRKKQWMSWGRGMGERCYAGRSPWRSSGRWMRSGGGRAMPKFALQGGVRGVDYADWDDYYYDPVLRWHCRL